MPYFITDKSADCSGWATIKDDGEVIGCHTTKQDAIDQMVAVSVAEDMQPGGERALPEELNVGDYVMWFNGEELLQGEIKEIEFDGELYVPNTNMVLLGTPFNPAALIQVYEEVGGGWKDTNNFVGVNFEQLKKSEDLESANEQSQPDLVGEQDPITATDIMNRQLDQQVAIVDIDGTLIQNGKRVEKVYNFLDDMSDTEIFIVTGRNSGERESTVQQLNDLSIDYDRLFMNPGSTSQTADFKKVTAENILKEFTVVLAIDNNATMRKVYSDLGIKTLNISDVPNVPSDQTDMQEENNRAINQEAPAYMRAAARRGLELNADGKGGDGLTDKTIREAREMADGRVSDDKWIRIAAWIARHMPDLDAPQNSDPTDSQYPGAGLVAHLLWGSGPSKRAAQRTMEYAQGVVERIRREEEQARWASVNVQLREKKEEKMPSKVERRVNDVTFEIRQGEVDANKMTFTGYAAVFNSPSEPLPFTEFIMPGAFKRSLKSRNEVKLFMNHNMDIVLGSTRAKTLRLTEDSKGLLAEAVLPDTTAGRDLSVLMQRGDVNSMSFGFSVPAKGDKWANDGMTRELHQIRLHEVSIVTGFPAYEATTASVRSIDALATRTGMSADVLADALTRLEAGENLSLDHASTINEAVAKLKESVPNEAELLAIKQKHLDLMLKAI